MSPHSKAIILQWLIGPPGFREWKQKISLVNKRIEDHVESTVAFTTSMGHDLPRMRDCCLWAYFAMHPPTLDSILRYEDESVLRLLHNYVG